MAKLFRYTIISPLDPGRIGAGAIWIDPSTEPPTVQVRNSTNDGWDSIGSNGGGGGTQKFASKDIFFNSVGLNDGLVIPIPEIDAGHEIAITNAWILPGGQPFNGTTPKADIGIAGEPGSGMFANFGAAPPDLTKTITSFTGLFFLPGGFSLVDAGGSDSGVPVQATLPISVWASQDGDTGGTAIGGSQGSATAIVEYYKLFD